MREVTIVISAGLNVRETAGQTGTIIEQVKEGARLIVLERKTFLDKFTWLKVEVEATKTIGWVDAHFVKIEPPKPAPAPMPTPTPPYVPPPPLPIEPLEPEPSLWGYVPVFAIVIAILATALIYAMR